jgi:hypothetical protein
MKSLAFLVHFLFFPLLISASALKVNLQRRSISRGFDSGNVEPAGGFLDTSGYIEIGSPPQKLRALFDTGSFNLVVIDSSEFPGGSSDGVGSYDASASNTSVNTTEKSFSSYADGSSVEGYYFTDSVTVAGLTVQDFKFGVGTTSDGLNTFGLGYFPDTTKAILPNYLQSQGLISRRVFNSYSDGDSQSGGIVFGGLDRGKYTGTLEKVPVFGNQGWYIALSGVSADCGYSNNNVYIVNLDTGAQVTYLPPEIYHQINQLFGGVITSSAIEPVETPAYLFKCSNAQVLTLDFSGKSIRVDPKTFVLPAVDASGNYLVDSDGDKLCGTTISESPNGEYSIGSDLLYNIFAVFDMDNAEIALAQSSTGIEDLVDITGDIPDAVSASRASKIKGPSGSDSYSTPTTTEVYDISLAMTYYQGTFSSGCSKSTFSFSSSSSAGTSTLEKRDSTDLPTSYRTRTTTTSMGTCFSCSTTSVPEVATNTFTATVTSCSDGCTEASSLLTKHTIYTTTRRVGTCFSCTTEKLTTTETVTACSGGCTTTLSPPRPKVSFSSVSSWSSSFTRLEPVEPSSSSETPEISSSSESAFVSSSENSVASSSVASSLNVSPLESTSSMVISIPLSSSPPSVSSDIQSSTLITTLTTVTTESHTSVFTIATLVLCTTASNESSSGVLERTTKASGLSNDVYIASATKSIPATGATFSETRVTPEEASTGLPVSVETSGIGTTATGTPSTGTPTTTDEVAMAPSSLFSQKPTSEPTSDSAVITALTFTIVPAPVINSTATSVPPIETQRTSSTSTSLLPVISTYEASSGIITPSVLMLFITLFF